jgi:hypothetical protein
LLLFFKKEDLPFYAMSDLPLDLARLRRPDPAPPPISRLEFLPGWITYGPIVAMWVALGLWYRDFSLPTAANPRVPTGGLCGERKTALLDLVAGAARDWVAPYTVIDTGADDLARAEAALAAAGLALPVVLKPDIGCNGTGVRLIRSRDALAAGLAAFPRGVSLVLQAFVPFAGEAGIFYIRMPGEARGRVTSLTLKTPPCVVGDGRSSLRALILADPRHARLQALYLERLAGRLDEVPAQGSVVQLVFAGNHCKGSIFRNGEADITAALEARIEAIARGIPEFYFGRFDVRFESIALLRRGEAFRIIEVNGVGAEATHIWDPATSLWEIWGAQLRHYGAAFEIARRLRKAGAKTSGLRVMYRDWRTQLRLMASYPLND